MHISRKSKAHLLYFAVATSSAAWMTSTAHATAYVWNGKANDGVWQNGTSTANWVGGAYAPGNSDPATGTNTITFADASYDQSISPSTITLQGGHNPNIVGLAINANVKSPMVIDIDGTSHIDMGVVAGTDALSVNAANCRIDSTNGGAIQLYDGGGSWRVSGTNVFTINAPINVPSQSNRGFVKQGGGTLVLNGSNAFDGVLQAANGIVQIASLADKGTNSAAGTGNTNATIKIGAANGFVGVLNYTGGDTSTNRPFELVMSATVHGPSYTFTNINPASTLTLTGGLQTSTTGNIASPALAYVGGDGNMIVNTVAMAGFMTVNKIGAGRLEVDVDSPWLGNTIVSQGTLLMNANHTPGAGNGTIDVQSGGTLGGTGTMLGVMTVETGGTLRPGNHGGAFHALSAVDIEGNFTVDLVAGSTNGELIASDAVTLGTLSTLSVVSDAPIANNVVYTIVTSPSAITGTFAGLSDGSRFSDGTNLYQINYTASAISLTVVPEPTTLTACGLGVITLMQTRRRRRCSNLI